MSDYVERGAAKHAADLAFDMTETEYDMLCKGLDCVPAADVAPVIHAHWTQTSKGVIYCSNCGAVCGIGAHIEEVTEDHYFCYYCGAKMDEEDTHE